MSLHQKPNAWIDFLLRSACKNCPEHGEFRDLHRGLYRGCKFIEENSKTHRLLSPGETCFKEKWEAK